MKKAQKFGVLNVKTVPHSPAMYVGLFQEARRRRFTAQYRGNRSAMIGSFAAVDDSDKVVGFAGDLHVYTDFNMNKPWFDRDAIKETPSKEVRNLPQHLRPEHEGVRFAFFPQRHRLVFDAGALSPRSAQRAFALVLTKAAPLVGIKEVEVVVQQSTDGLDELFRMESLRFILIRITRPNPDDNGDLDKLIQERLKKIGARSETQTYQADSQKALKPDNEMRELAKLALTDGNVVVRGIDKESRKVVERTTSSHPLLVSRPVVEGTHAEFMESARSVVKKN